MQSLTQVLSKVNFENSFLIGYYGGTNYGDELLLEVMLNFLKDHKIENVSFGYSNQSIFSIYHHKTTYHLVNVAKKRNLIKSCLQKDNIIIGGGGYWGLDSNLNILLLSFWLLICRFMGKSVYLVGVGYYESANIFGRIGAYFASKASKLILARDLESLKKFQKLSNGVVVCNDLAFYIPDRWATRYQAEIKGIQQTLSISGSTTLITLRRMKGQFDSSYAQAVQQLIAQSSKQSFIVMLLESRKVDETGYRYLIDQYRNNDRVQVTEYSFNPIAFYFFLKKHHKKLRVIGPQYHLILTAYRCRIPYFPMSYDNKVANLLSSANMIKHKAPTKTNLTKFLNQTI